MTTKKPFYEEHYQQLNENFYPMVNIQCWFGKKKVSLTALADTGCDSGMVLLKNEVSLLKEKIKGLELGEKINDEPIPVSVADGHIVGADAYIVNIELGEEQKKIDLLVIDSNNIIGETEKIDAILPLIGRNFLNNFDVLFKGKAKKLVIFKEF
jgi:predicted aspartyl protease